MNYYLILVVVAGVIDDKFLPVYGQDGGPLKLAQAQTSEEIRSLTGLAIADRLPTPNKSLTLKLASTETQNISCTSSDLDFFGDLIISSDQSTGSGRIGDSLFCWPNDRCNSSTTDVYLKLVTAGDIFRPPGIKFTKAGTGTLQCVAAINGNTVTKSISVTLSGDPSVICTSSDLDFSGNLTFSLDQSTGTGRVGDTMACKPNARCWPSTINLYLQRMETSEIFSSASVVFLSAGRGSFQCVATINEYRVTKITSVTISGALLNVANTLVILVIAGATSLLQKS